MNKKINSLIMTVVMMIVTLSISAPTNVIGATKTVKTCLKSNGCNIELGQSCKIPVQCGNNCTVSYKCSNSDVATVSSKGNVKAISCGTAKVTVCIKDKKTKKKTILKYNVKVNKCSKKNNNVSNGNKNNCATNNVSSNCSSVKTIIIGNGNCSNSQTVNDLLNQLNGLNASNNVSDVSKNDSAKNNTTKQSDKASDSNVNQSNDSNKSNSISSNLTEEIVYQRMIALKSKYPEGMRFTNADKYYSPGIRLTGYGCVAFALILSDEAFGANTPATKVNNPSASQVHIGDILRVNNDTHSVIVLEIKDDSFVIAEGNYNSSVHWGRVMKKSEKINYLYTRW